MRAVRAEVTSSKPISLSKAAAIISHFTASETGARPDVAAYVRRAAASFEELVSVHRDIRHQKNVLQKDGMLSEEENSSHRKMRSKKARCFGENSHIGNPVLDQQDFSVLFDGSLEGNRVVQAKAAKVEEKRGKVGNITESNVVVANKMESKKEKKEEQKQKKEKEELKQKKGREESKAEMKREEVASGGKRSEGRAHKENRQDGSLLRNSTIGLVSEAITSERKKRKHSYLTEGEMNGEMEQHKVNGKNKWRKVK